MGSFRQLIAVVALFLAAATATPAWADDGPPLPPPLPDSEDVLQSEFPEEEALGEPPAEDLAPAAIAPPYVPAPESVTPPRLERRSSCCWPRDKCGWALGPCGGRVGRLSITLEGGLVLFDSLDGTLGEPRANSLDWDQNEYDPEFGARATIGFAVAPRDRIEARGVWYGDLSAQSAQAGAFGYSPPAGGATAVTAATLRNTAELFSGEANWWREFCCKGKMRFRGVLGARYLRLEETAYAQMQSGAAAPITGTVNSSVKTDMIAGQIGAALHWLAAPRLEFGVSGKALLGSMRRRISINDSDIFVGGAHSSRSEKTDFAFGGELEVTATTRLTRSFSVTASYALLYVDGVVRPNDAMDFSQANTGAVVARQSKSELLVHAFFLGFSLDL